MRFEFSAEQRQFVDEVRSFIAEEMRRSDAGEIFDPDREADSMLVDSQPRRAFMKRLAASGYLGMSWPAQ